ncbi:MAG: molecular chaperone DnaJ [Sphingomonadales bacterium]|nr:MAG: molecular chaperone DnaJ [Sphingomonadales bacterium]
MLRLLIIAGVLSIACKLIFGRWPWDYLKGKSTRQQAVLRARKLLGVRAEANHGEIMEAHKRLITMVHPDRGGSNEQVHEANAARDILLDELPSQE